MGAAEDEPTAARIDALLRRGLQHYGTGNAEDALRCWREVLALDPEHAEARDYVATAEGVTDGATAAAAAPAPAPAPAQAGPEEPPPPPMPAADPLEALAGDAQRMLADGDFDAALDLLEAIARRDPARLEVHGWIEHARSQLVKRYRERLGDLSGVPRQRIGASDLLRFNLPAHAGFLLSLVDGETSVGDLVSLSGMDAFEALRVLHGLFEAGIVSVEAPAGA